MTEPTASVCTHLRSRSKQCIALISDYELFDLFVASLTDVDKFDGTLQLAQYLTNLLNVEKSSVTLT